MHASVEIGTPLSPHALRVLLLGAGELGKEVAIELQRFGVEVIAADRYADAPAMQVAHRSHVLDMLDGDAIRALVARERPHLVVPEIEAIRTQTLVELEAEGAARVIPTARAAWLTMDREGIRRLAAETLQLPTSPYRFVDTEQALLEAIDGAREQILVQAYLFTSKPLARGLIAAHRRGVRVEVLLDAESNRPNSLSVMPELLNAGIPVAVETRYNIAHNKLMIIDPASRHGAVATGSYNFTRSARVANAENMLILRDNPALAQAYARNWQRHRAEALRLDSLDDLPARRGKQDGRESDR